MQQRFTDEQFKRHLKGEFYEVADRCLVCLTKLSVSWTDRNGEAKCNTCGMPYDILGCRLSDETLKRLGLEKSEIAQKYTLYFPELPLLRAFWHDSGSFIPLGSYLPPNPLPDSVHLAFIRWLHEHSNTWREAYEDMYNWDKIAQTVAENSDK